MATEYVAQSNLDALKSEMRGEFALVRGEFASVRGEFSLVRGEMAAMEGRLRQEIGSVQKEIGKQYHKLVFANFAAMIGFGGIVFATARLG